jgi:hypothetical protein
MCQRRKRFTLDRSTIIWCVLVSFIASTAPGTVRTPHTLDCFSWREPFISYIKDIKQNPPSPKNDLEHLNRFQRMINSNLSAFEQEWIKTVLGWD